ncbi:MAG: hypothetical protein ACFFBV_16230 [Promethearchaeota archaeon]
MHDSCHPRHVTPSPSSLSLFLLLTAYCLLVLAAHCLLLTLKASTCPLLVPPSLPVLPAYCLLPTPNLLP